MRMLLNVTFNDSTSREAVITAADIVRTEDKFEISIEKLERYSHLCFLAWASESRTKVTGKDFDEWLNDVASVESIEDPKGSTTNL